MRIVEAISDSNIGGAGRLLLERLRRAHDNIRNDTVVILPKGSALLPMIGELGVKAIEVDGCVDRSFDIGAVSKIGKILREEKPEVINCHGCLSARLAAAFCLIPVRIYTRHCVYKIPRYMKMIPIRQILGGVSLLISNGAVAVADAAAENLAEMGYARDRIRVIINGVGGLEKYGEERRREVRRKYGAEGYFTVGICARLESCKDHECFLRAARILSRRSESYRFMIVGTGSLEERLKELTRILGIEDRVIFCGFCHDVTDVFNCFDLNVNCSCGTETSSLALSEGMSIGLPAVASSYGGNPHMVKDGINGLIYPVGNFFELAERIEDIASDRELYRKLSSGARRRFESEFDSRIMTESTYAYYDELLEKR